MYEEWLSNCVPDQACAETVPAFPVKVGALTLPVAVVVWLCVPRALPVKVCAATVLEEPVKVCAATVLDEPVKVCAATVLEDPVNVWAATVLEEPVKVWAATVLEEPVNVAAECVGTPAGQDSVWACAAVGFAAPEEPVAEVAASPAAVGTPAGHEIAGALLVPSGVTVDVPLLPNGVTVEVALVPNGVTVEVALVPNGVTVEVALLPNGVTAEVPFVPAGVPALSELDATESPAKDGAEFDPAGVKLTVPFVPAGVIKSLPPVVPTSACTASVPTNVKPSSAEYSINPAGQVPATTIIIPAMAS